MSSNFSTVLNIVNRKKNIQNTITTLLTDRYNMNGTDQGELRLHVLEDIGAGFDAPVWVLYGNQGNYWKRASLNIQAPLPFKVSL